MQLAPSWKLTVSAEDSRQEPGKPLHSFGKLGIIYKDPMITFSSNVDVVNGPKLQAALIGRYGLLTIGTQATCNAHFDDKTVGNLSGTAGLAAGSPEIVDLSLNGSLCGTGWLACFKTIDYMKLARLAYIQRINPSLSVGAQVDYGIKVNTQKFLIGTKLK